MQTRTTTTLATTNQPTTSSLGIGESTKLSLKPTTTSNGFVFPSIYNFPPFFTKQVNEQTWQHQRNQWVSLILTYTRYHRIFKIDLTDEQLNLDLFNNVGIKRKLNLETLRAIVESMVGAGQAEYESTMKKDRSLVWIYWKKPQEWATLIYDWIKDKGLTNSIMTFYELTEGGEMVETADFYQLPEPILRKALEVLSRSGKCQIFKGIGEDGDGVKFA